MRRLTFWMLLLSGLSTAVFAETAPNPASAPVITAPVKDIRQSGFVYCVNGMINTFNPQKASSELIIDTLATQLYDRLLDVDPYTYRLIPKLAQSWEVLDGGATYRFRLRKDVPFQQAQKILEQQLPVLPLASSLRLQAYRYDIKGLVLSPFGNSSFAGVFRDDEGKKAP